MSDPYSRNVTETSGISRMCGTINYTIHPVTFSFCILLFCYMGCLKALCHP